MEDYKEKLRLAKEALDSGSYDKETIEYVFPELKESEEESVKEDIISLVNEFWERIGSINPEYSSRSKMLAWLEKQDKKNQMNILEDYVSFEIAKLLKEKGFDWECISYYVDDEPDDVKYSFCGETNTIWESRCCSAPTLQMAMKWLREVHNKNVVLDMVPLNEDCYVLWTFNICCNKNYKIMWGTKQPKYNTYEEACEAAILYCLTNLI